MQDTTYVQRKLEGALEYLATEDISGSVTISSETVVPTVRTIPVFTVYNSSYITTGLNLKIDTRDDPYAPTEGILIYITRIHSAKKVLMDLPNILDPMLKHQLIFKDFL